MATYKVIQDIEAEDKLVGPLSLRQFIYAGVGAFLGYLSVISFMNGAAFLLAVFVPPMAFCLFFAWPWSPDQPTEVWALARIRYYFKPRRRIWDQSGVRELVTITVPKKIERTYTDGLSQTEVKSRLRALADTIDSRGWVIKNSNVNLSAISSAGTMPNLGSDRLINYENAPREVPEDDITPSDDILDPQNNPIAYQFDQLINASTKEHRRQIMDKLRQNGATVPATPSPAGGTVQPPNDYWFLHQQAQAPTGQSGSNANDVVFSNPKVVQPGVDNSQPNPTPTADDEATLAEALKSQASAKDAAYSHLNKLDPSTGQTATPAARTPQTDPVTLNLAHNNDLNVSTLAREAQKARQPKQPPDDEVVISLH